jgi:hypothetical protein
VRLVLLGLLVASAAVPAASASRAGVEDVYVRAANRGDYATVCHLYSHRYLKVSQAACRELYRSGEVIFGPYDYKIVHRRTLANGHRRIDLTLRHHASFIELAHEAAGWRIVAGGF